MNKKFIAILAVIIPISSNVKSATLTEILAKYCVPKGGDSAVTKLACDNKATYTQINDKESRCDCLGVDGAHKNWTFYDTTTRYCQDCIYGSFTTETSHNDRESCEPIKCPEGYVAKCIGEGCPPGSQTYTSCPSGYVLKEIKNNCGTGFKLKTYNTKTQTFN